MSGVGSWNEIKGYCKAKFWWLKSFLKLPGGVPSHGTFNRVISALGLAEFEKGFAVWLGSIVKLTAGEVVAIDGKTLCGTRERGKATWCIWFRPGPAPTTSCWASAGSMKSPMKSLPSCSMLALSGTVITIYAMGCQKSIAERVVAKQANYILAAGDCAIAATGPSRYDVVLMGGTRPRIACERLKGVW